MNKLVKNIDSYIDQFPVSTQILLRKFREVVKYAAPDAEEVISYGMPCFKLNGALLYFAAYKNHIGFYPCPSALEKYKKEISKFKHSKGAVQFPLESDVPWDLISKIIRFRVAENLSKIAKGNNKY